MAGRAGIFAVIHAVRPLATSTEGSTYSSLGSADAQIAPGLADGTQSVRVLARLLVDIGCPAPPAFAAVVARGRRRRRRHVRETSPSTWVGDVTGLDGRIERRLRHREAPRDGAVRVDSCGTRPHHFGRLQCRLQLIEIHTAFSLSAAPCASGFAATLTLIVTVPSAFLTGVTVTSSAV